jgi:CRISPR-associated endonuclease Csn1
MKRVLGLDLGTNSIGWALVEQDFKKKEGKILGLGSRIVPMSQDILDTFGKGQSYSQTADRTKARSIRKLYQRDNLRRERLHRVLDILGFLPEHYSNQIDFETHKGQFINHAEPKLPYIKREDGSHEFLFKDSFNEMIEEFRRQHAGLLENGKKLPYDWTIYYLRKKAITQKIEKEELAWLILNFNQKRGYYQLSEDENSEDDTKKEEYHSLDVVEVVDTGETKRTGEIWYHVKLNNGWVYPRASKIPLTDWVGKTKEFIVTTKLNTDGSVKTNKYGDDERSFRAPKEDDWGLLKKKTEHEIDQSDKTVGSYIFDSLLENPSQKIRGKLIRTIERKFYKEEFTKILKKQIEEHAELRDGDLYQKCIYELYPNNDAHRKNIEGRNFLYLLKDDILFYQRPLKTKTHLISDCAFEYRVRKDTKEKIPLKCIAKSHPLFQEFRLWQFVANLKLCERQKESDGVTKFEVDITSSYLSAEDKSIELFKWLNDKEDVTQKQLLAFFKLKEDKFRWNYVEDKIYPCNETRAKFLKRIKKIEGVENEFFTTQTTQTLWHILYSVTDPEERKKAISTFASKNGIGANQDFIDSFSRFPAYKREYGSFSEKALKKLLPLMRKGEFWIENQIIDDAKSRANSILERLETINSDVDRIEEVADDEFPKQVIKSFLKSGYAQKGLNTFQASYLVYGRHSEAKDTAKWNTPQDVADYLNPKLKGSFKQHSLRNPIVEQVITETLRVVMDIWNEFGNGQEDYFHEIHIELGREMKNDKKTRERITNQISQNENTNQRIKAVLNELKNEGVDHVKPYSPSQQDILKLYEEGIYQNKGADFSQVKEDEIEKIRKNNSPTKAEIQRYKLWLEQGYISPYTGQAIRLSQLFTHKYEIEHIYPRARYFDDSLGNKIICESEINKLKDNMTAFEFISEFGGTNVDIGHGKLCPVLSLETYQEHVKSYFGKNKSKLQRLLSPDIPESFINRQMNDSRYISKVVKGLLSKIVRVDEEQEATSKKVISVTGAITSQMKQDWGLNDIWNDIISPRFERMNELTKSQDYGEINPNTRKFLPKVPDSISKGFNKKRIDHRHHALDALVIAIISRNHINYLNNLNAKDENDKSIKHELRNTLCFKSKLDNNGNYKWHFYKPWESFTQDAKARLEITVVSFKQNTRVINKTKNKYQKWIADDKGELKKKLVPQTKGDSWAIRKAMHKDTVYGKVSLLRNGKEIEATAGRVALSEKFTRKQLESITDTGIQKILNNHVKNYVNEKGVEQFDFAFNTDGADELNKNIVELNGGKFHQPIYKVRLYEVGNKFALGVNGNRADKYVEAAKGTNLFFAIYWDEAKQKRAFETVPLNVVIEHQKQVAKLNKKLRVPIPPNPEKGQFLFSLSPNDLVYVPTDEELDNPSLVNINALSKEQVQRIYKMEKASGVECYFIRNDIASLIKQYDSKSKTGEFSSQNKLETTLDLIDPVRIKECCWKLKIDRLGGLNEFVR